MTHTAIFNMTQGTVEMGVNIVQVENYWRTCDVCDCVYINDDVAFVDDEVLREMTHEDLLDSGWEVM